MSKTYPAYKWCAKYNMWCDDVFYLTDGENECEGECAECDYADGLDKEEDEY